MFKQSNYIILTLIFFCGLAQTAEHNNISPINITKNVKPHVLFISIDDMRPEIGIYGAKLAHTPNIDKLAQQGIRFNRAYAQQAICGPSRASIMTGMRPDTIEVTHNYLKFRHKLKDVVTIPQHFMNNGYNATYVGKIFHHGDKDEALSWNWPADPKLLPNDLKKPKTYAIAENVALQVKNRQEMFEKYGEQAKYGLGRGPATEGANVPDNAYIDGYNTDLAIVTLKDMLAKSDKPIFFGFGMNKPHLPWIAPKKYWDMYRPSDIKLAKKTTSPINGAQMGLHASFELRTFYDIPNYGEIPPELAIKLKHAYLACASYIDAQIGRMLKALEDEGVLENTIVILWSDHGYHLGDMGIWGKASNYDIATRVPMIISTAKTRTSPQALESNALVELIDIYPTISALAGLSPPKGIEGQSLVKLIENPTRNWKSAAFSQFPSPALREWGAYPLRKGMRETYFGPLITAVEERIKDQQQDKWQRELFEQYLMGYSMRTKQYRLISWVDVRDKSQKPIFIELYDHKNDPNETVNIALEAPLIVKKLLMQLSEGPQGSMAAL